MSLFYNIYLELSDSARFYPDFFTHLVAVQSQFIMELFGYSVYVDPHKTEASLMVFVNDHFLIRVVEGCNSLSIIILFSSFVLAFFAQIRTTLFFILAGAVIIYIMNIVRIAILTIGIYKYPHHGEFLHSIVFPLIIYGTVFTLWLIWVRIFTKTTAYENQV